ncbi:hypothetical protein IC744_05035 [Microbacterium hominis]|uniref:hypothetical protein n=1 Tax=Microbacterium TaxID=33882 RepID=UPI00168B4E0B|nr:MULTISPECIES: hypothetical protein [Microbacterium]QOC25727.1 hypothetical protein IC745_15690 [Microbacterium hominis]QOC29716.1 hypothetical protein IC744_05035 [Microbacterium hominis]QYF97899.1 hypothetical protein KY498_01125 [Microbacterium sp. PAMC21962]
MVTRRQAGAAIALAVVWGLTMSGCTPQPEPAPSASATGFASDEEAFAAAEATYRAYVDATNARRLDPDSRPDPTDFLTGQALTSSINAQRRFEEEGIRLVGITAVESVSRVSRTATATTIQVCLNNSGTKVLDTGGTDVTPPDRPTSGGLEVVIVNANQQVSLSSTNDSGC